MAADCPAPSCPSLADRRLLQAARRGDGSALEALVRASEPIIDAAVAGLFAPGLERDDLRQVGRLAVLGAVAAWDPARAPFADFAYGCVRRRALTAVTAARRRRHAPLNDAVSLERAARTGDDREPASALLELLPLSGGLGMDPLERVLLRERLAEMGVRVQRLTERERRSLTLLSGGATHAAIAAELGASVKQVDNALQRARRKLAA